MIQFNGATTSVNENGLPELTLWDGDEKVGTFAAMPEAMCNLAEKLYDVAQEAHDAAIRRNAEGLQVLKNYTV